MKEVNQSLSVSSRSSLYLHNRIVPLFGRFSMATTGMALLFRTIFVRSRHIPQRSPNHNRKDHVKIHIHDNNHEYDMEKSMKDTNHYGCCFLPEIKLLTGVFFVLISNDRALTLRGGLKEFK